MGVNNQQVSYSFGQMGSIHCAGVEAITTSVPDTVFVAITFLEATVFDSSSAGLIPSTDVDGTLQLFPSSTENSTSIDANGGDVVDSETFPAGVTIYGRWTGFKLSSGRVIAYIGH